MKTNVPPQADLKAMMAAARATHAFKVETAIMEFTEDLVRLMEERGVTKSELARRMGVNPAYITKIMRGSNNFTLDTIVKVGTALDCDFRCHLVGKEHHGEWFDFLKAEPERSAPVFRSADFVTKPYSQTSKSIVEIKPQAA